MPFLRTSVSRLCDALTLCGTGSYTQAAETQIVVMTEILERLKVLLKGEEPRISTLCNPLLIQPKVAITEECSHDILPHPESFVTCLFSLLQSCLEPPYSNFVGVDACISNAIHVLFESCHINPQVWSQTSTDSRLQELVYLFLVNDSRSAVRDCMYDAIAGLCTQTPW